MKRIKYPTIEDIIKANKRVLESKRFKKADKHDLLGTRSDMEKIINKTKRTRGDIYRKASVLMKGIITNHIFASGNRRTAYMATRNFLENNKKSIQKKKRKETSNMFKKIRESNVSNNEVSKWLKNK